MGAYIINVPDSVDRVVYINVDPMDGKTYIASYSVDNLTPYTEPDLEQVRADAYNDGYKVGREAEKVRQPNLEQVRKEGYEEGKKQAKVQAELDVCHDIEKVAKENYKAGLSDAWEAVRKIYDLSQEDRLEIFPEASTFVVADICDRYSASECVEKIRQYEQEKEEEIQVGDEVATDAGNRASVLYENPDGTQVFVFKSDGTAAWWTKSALHRTGRNFFEIATVLKKMRGEQDG